MSENTGRVGIATDVECSDTNCNRNYDYSENAHTTFHLNLSFDSASIGQLFLEELNTFLQII